MKIALARSVLMGLLLPLTQARVDSATSVLEQETEMMDELGRKKKQETGWHAPVRVSFEVDHFKSFTDNGTSEFNKKLAMGAFNRAFEQVFEGMSSDWGFIDSLIQVPEPEEDVIVRRAVSNDENELSRTRPRPSPSPPRPAPPTRRGGTPARPAPAPHRPAPVRPPIRYNTYTIAYGDFSVDARCRLCPQDFVLGRSKNGGGESFANFLNDQDKWDEVAKLFCMELQGTGIENFAEVKNCAFTVSYLGEAEVGRGHCRCGYTGKHDADLERTSIGLDDDSVVS